MQIFFAEAEQTRLGRLMEKFHDSLQSAEPLSSAEQAELEALVEAELRASAQRAATLAEEAGR